MEEGGEPTHFIAETTRGAGMSSRQGYLYRPSTFSLACDRPTSMLTVRVMCLLISYTQKTICNCPISRGYTL